MVRTNSPCRSTVLAPRLARSSTALLAVGLLNLALPVGAVTNPVGFAAGSSALDDGSRILVDTLLREGPRAEPDTVRDLAEIGTPEALDGLLEALPKLTTIELRMTVMDGLRHFDGVPGAGERAAELLAQSAVQSDAPDVAEAALDSLAACPVDGPEALTGIVNSGAPFGVREPALRFLVPAEGEELEKDRKELFLDIYRATPPPPGVRLSKKQGIVYSHGMREIAFSALAPTLDQRTLTKATKDDSGEIRLVALVELDSRPKSKMKSVAKDIYKRKDNPLKLRVRAADILLRENGAKFAKSMADDVSNINTIGPTEREELSLLLSAYLAENPDKKVQGNLVKWLEKGDPAEQVVALRALGHDRDPEVAALRRALVDSEEPGVRRVAVEVLITEARDTGGADGVDELLAGLFERNRNQDEQLDLLEALDPDLRGDAEWERKLVKLAGGKDLLLRNAALVMLSERPAEEHEDVVILALGHEHWSTRLCAVKAVDHMRSKAAVPFLIDRLDEEDHRRLSNEVVDVLQGLSGQQFGQNATTWRRWWQDNMDDFEPLSVEERSEFERELEKRRRRDVTTSFFGIDMRSDRIVFVIDVSGSMEFPLSDSPDGEKRVRFDVVKSELLRCLDVLPSDCWIDIVVFSGGTGAYKGELFQLTAEARDAAKAWVGELTPGGGTNIHDAVGRSLSYDEADTVFLLSDGEPSVGPIVEMNHLRRVINRWNKYRGTLFETISIATQLPLLDWIATDSGGVSVRHF